MDQGSNKNHSPAYNFTPTVTKFCVMWEGLSLPHDTKFGNCRCKIVDSRSFHSWSLIHGLRWSGLIKVGPDRTAAFIDGKWMTIKYTYTFVHRIRWATANLYIGDVRKNYTARNSGAIDLIWNSNFGVRKSKRTIQSVRCIGISGRVSVILNTRDRHGQPTNDRQSITAIYFCLNDFDVSHDCMSPWLSLWYNSAVIW